MSKKRGRPPMGDEESGVPRIRDYPKSTFPIHPELTEQLDAASRAFYRPKWRIVEEALEHWFLALDKGQQDAVKFYRECEP